MAYLGEPDEDLFAPPEYEEDFALPEPLPEPPQSLPSAVCLPVELSSMSPCTDDTPTARKRSYSPPEESPERGVARKRRINYKSPGGSALGVVSTPEKSEKGPFSTELPT